MKIYLLLLAIQCISSAVSINTVEIKILEGFVGLYEYKDNVAQNFKMGGQYTFDISFNNSQTQDYMVESCTMNGYQFMGQYGCLQCNSFVIKSIETDGYNKSNRQKRTLVHFYAPSNQISIQCTVIVVNCSGCAERSCERRPNLSHFHTIQIPYSCQTMIGLPSCGLFNSAAATPIIPMAGIMPSPSRNTGMTETVREHRSIADWLIYGLLLLALLLMILALCCCRCLWMLRERRRKTFVKEKIGVGVATKDTKTLATQTDNSNNSTYIPAENYITRFEKQRREEMLRSTVNNSNIGDQEMNDHVNRTNDHSQRDRYITNDASAVYKNERNLWAIDNGRHTYDTYIVRDGNPYSHQNVNPSFHSDLSRVVPVEGYDTLETTERQLYLDDDEDLVEKDIKRTHTTKYVRESREVNGEPVHTAQNQRGDDVHHAIYAQSYPA